MEPGTQSALIIVWVLFWMLTLSLMMVHPMFRPARIQIRRSLRMNLNRWRIVQQKLRIQRFRAQGYCRIRFGKALLWLADRVENSESPPFWVRCVTNLLFNFIFMYVFWHLICRQPMTWSYVVGYLTASWGFDGVKLWSKRRKQQIPEKHPVETSPVKPANEQGAEQ